MLTLDQIKNNIYKDKNVSGKSSVLQKEYDIFLDYLQSLNRDNLLEHIDFFMYCANFPHYYYSTNGKR